MADNVLDFKIQLEPQIENLDKIKNQLSSAVKEVGDKDLSQQFLQIESKIKSIQNTMDSFKDKSMPIESFKIINKNIGETLKLMQKLGGGLSSAFGDDSFKQVEKIDRQIEQLSKDIEISANKLKQYKKTIELNDATGQIQLKKSYENAIISSANIHRFKQNGEMSKSKVASRENLEKIRADIAGRSNQTPEMKAELTKIDQVLSKLDTTLNDYKTKFTQESENYKNLQQERTNLEGKRAEEVTKAEANATKIDNLDAKQAEVQKLNIAVLDAQTQNQMTGQAGKSGGSNGDDPTQLDKAANGMQNLNKEVDKQPSKIGQAVKSFASYTVVIGTLRRAIRSAIKTVRTLDKALTEQAMVSGRTRESTYKLLRSYQNIAMQSGATTKEVAQVATQYFRQGKTAKDALTLTEAAVKAAKVASISTADSVDYLTTAINGFKLAAEDAMTVSDKFSALAASSATSYEELAIALSKVASQANLAGMSMDYTLGLLAKGIETTREAPETIGTALKTVIARMRELKDYGETLDGEGTINNVEQQLQYVGIALRNQQGELRSTEDVLDELGQKWDTLSSNQQAAIAKALAGTRQQSRLISMMQDYGRTMELVQISERSAGATAAQADTYMQGMEASLNKITVAWEKFTTAFTQDGSLIVQVLDTFGTALDRIAEFSSTLEGQRTIYSALGMAILGIVSAKIAQVAATNAVVKAEKQQQISQLQANREATKTRILALQNKKAILEEAKATAKGTNETLQNAIAKASAAGETEKVARFQKLLQESGKDDIDINQELQKTQIELNQATADYNQSITTEAKLTAETKAGFLSQIPVIGQLVTSLLSMVYMTTISSKAMVGLEGAGVKAGTNIQLAFGWISLVMSLIAGLIAAIVTLTAVTNDYKSEAEKTTESIRSLNTEINHINQTSAAIETAIAKFKALDATVIKTTEDYNDMRAALDAAAEKLTEAQKAEYDSKRTNEERKEYLETIQDELDNRKRVLNTERLLLLQKHKGDKEVWDNASNTAAVYDTVNQSIEKYIDDLKAAGLYTAEQASNLEKMAKATINAMEAQKLYEKAVDMGKAETLIGEDKDTIKNKFKDYGINLTDKEAKEIRENGLGTDTLAKMMEEKGKTEQYNKLLGEMGAAGAEAYAEEFTNRLRNIRFKGTELFNIFDNDDYSLKDQLEAYGEALKHLSGEELKAFKEAEGYGGKFGAMWDFLQKKVTDTAGVMDKISNYNISAKQINDFVKQLQAIPKMSGPLQEETALTVFEKVVLGDPSTQKENLDSLAASLGYAKDEFEAFKNKISDFKYSIGGGGFQTLTQNIDDLTNRFKTFYETQSKWAEMSDTERSNFMQQYQKEFAQEGFYEAFISGQNLEEYLKSNDFLNQQKELYLKQIEEAIEAAEIAGEWGNAQYLRMLKERLLNADVLYKRSLKDEMEMQQDYLEKYKSFREKEVEELTKALEKQKEAYEKYFEAINRDIEDQDWLEQQQLLVDNLTKLSGATDATSLNKMASLQETLEQNLKEREKELRERAQEALVQSIEDQVTKIEETLEEEFSNVNALLASLLSEEQQQKYLENMLTQISNDKSKTSIEQALDIQELLSSARALGINPGVSITESKNGDTTNYNVSIGSLDLTQLLGTEITQRLAAGLIEAGYSGTQSNSKNI